MKNFGNSSRNYWLMLEENLPKYTKVSQVDQGDRNTLCEERLAVCPVDR